MSWLNHFGLLENFLKYIYTEHKINQVHIENFLLSKSTKHANPTGYRVTEKDFDPDFSAKPSIVCLSLRETSQVCTTEPIAQFRATANSWSVLRSKRVRLGVET